VAFTLDSRRKQRFDFMRALYDKAEGSETGLIYLEELAEEIHLSEIETEIIAIYLADEGLIKIRMRHIVSITHQGIDEVETILADPDKATQHFPPLHTFTRPHENFQHSAGPIPSRQEYVRPPPPPSPAPPSPPPPAAAPEQEPSKEELDAIELKNICEAIGLDPGEFAGEPADHVPAMLGNSSLGSDLGSPLRQEISGNPVSLLPHSYSEELLAESLPAMPEPPAVSARRQDIAEATEPTPAVAMIAETLASLKLRLLKLRLAPEDMAEAQAEIDTVVAQLFSSRPKQQIITTSLKTLLAIFYEGGAPLLTEDVENSLAKIRAYLRQS
jgi:hypothetical protein